MSALPANQCGEANPYYFAELASQTTDLIQKLGWPLAIAMAIGALAGALSTMYSSVAARAVEIATLRAIGFGPFPAFVRTIVESLVLAAAGGVIGAAATYLGSVSASRAVTELQSTHLR